MSWGPSHQQTRRRRLRRSKLLTVVGWFALVLATYPVLIVSEIIFVGGIAIGIWWVARLLLRARGVAVSWRRRARQSPLEQARAQGVGVHLGITREGVTRRARGERAVLVLGPPRAGKTTSVIIPTLLAHTGAVVSTSTKPDVMAATHWTRSGDGKVWQFDPTGTTTPQRGVEVLRWSPVLCSVDWDGALLMARAMVTGAGVGHGTTDASHWTRRAQALLAPLLHAAAVGGREIGDVVDWVVSHELDEPGVLLVEHDAVKLAAGQLVGLQNTEARERSSIFSAAADALDGYTSQAALNAATQPNFFAGRFVNSTDTIYIHAPAEQQHLVAPLVCGLLSEIRRATYEHHRNGTLRQPVLFALDEIANIAPLSELPQIASEGGSQGVVLLAALQDLSQARARWGTAADGFLTLFGTKLLLGGIADHTTLETVSAALGEYDRQVVCQTRPSGGVIRAMISSGRTVSGPSTTYSTQRTRRLSPGDIARIPTGRALHLDGVRWELLTLTPAFATEPWRTLTTPAES